MSSEREKMLAGEPYVVSDPELQMPSRRALRLAEAYNRTSIDEPAERGRILEELLGSVGIGPRTFANFGLVTRDLPANVVAVGNPARVIRSI